MIGTHYTAKSISFLLLPSSWLIFQLIDFQISLNVSHSFPNPQDLEKSHTSAVTITQALVAP